MGRMIDSQVSNDNTKMFEPDPHKHPDHLPGDSDRIISRKVVDVVQDVSPPSLERAHQDTSTYEGVPSMLVIGENSTRRFSSFDETTRWRDQFEMEPCLGLGNHPSMNQEYSHTAISESSTTGPVWTVPSTTVVSADTVARDAQQARERAMEILRKFQATSSASSNTHHHHSQYGTDHNYYGPESNNTGNPLHPTGEVAVTLVSPSEYSRRRRECLDSLEERKRLSLLKNLEYVARIEDERLRHQLDQIEQAKAYQTLMDEQHLRRIQSDNQSKHAVSQAGIGTQQRQRIEQKRKSGRPTDGNNSSSSSSSLAIYVSNLPIDGSVDEQVMRSLFGSYGALRKIHFYGDKSTGNLKGDALVIYNLQQGQDRALLTQAVCSQMNGCELPGGTVLMVEPSDPSYKQRKESNDDGSHYGPAPSVHHESTLHLDAVVTTTGGNTDSVEAAKDRGLDDHDNDDDNLDDFFASLE